MNKKLLVAVSVLATVFSAQAQYLRTSYFMESASTRVMMNPALQPTRGFLNLPALGGISVTAESNTLGIQDIMDIANDDNNFLYNDKLYNTLKTNNRFNLDMNLNILSFGWIKGKNFWSVNAGLRMDMGMQINKGMFDMMREMDGYNMEDLAGTHREYSLGNQKINMNAYAEVGLGFSRRITEKLTVGARAKVLLGLARAEANIDKFDVNLDLPKMPADIDIDDIPNMTDDEISSLSRNYDYNDWYGKGYNYNAQANIVTTIKGGGLVPDEYDPNMIGFDLDAGNLGIAGSGFGIDLGASYNVWDNLTVSAAVLDLGFLKWNKKNTKDRKSVV